MKRQFFLLVALALLASCHNQPLAHPDYKYNAVYFPLQYPIRTLVLGDSRSDNSLDKKLEFHIGVSIGGMYHNTKSWTVGYVVDTSLVPQGLTTTKGDTVRILPSSYYTLSPVGQVTIPADSFSGLILVRLKDAFLDDPLAITGDYVIPLRITSSNADSILSGVPFVPKADRNVAADWDPNALPKDYVLFAVKYINPYHGNYFHRGVDIGVNATGDTVSRSVYHQPYVVDDQVWTLTTTARNTVVADGIGSLYAGNTKMTLDIDTGGAITISPAAGSAFGANGVGRYVRGGDSWGGTAQNAMFLNYIYQDGAISHIVTDTLVFRDNGVTFQQFAIQN
jgi:hypothetical protein